MKVDGPVAALESIIAEVLAEVNEKMEKAGFRYLRQSKAAVRSARVPPSSSGPPEAFDLCLNISELNRKEQTDLKQSGRHGCGCEPPIEEVSVRPHHSKSDCGCGCRQQEVCVFRLTLSITALQFQKLFVSVHKSATIEETAAASMKPALTLQNYPVARQYLSPTQSFVG